MKYLLPYADSESQCVCADYVTYDMVLSTQNVNLPLAGT